MTRIKPTFPAKDVHILPGSGNLEQNSYQTESVQQPKSPPPIQAPTSSSLTSASMLPSPVPIPRITGANAAQSSASTRKTQFVRIHPYQTSHERSPSSIRSGSLRYSRINSAGSRPFGDEQPLEHLSKAFPDTKSKRFQGFHGSRRFKPLKVTAKVPSAVAQHEPQLSPTLSKPYLDPVTNMFRLVLFRIPVLLTLSQRKNVEKWAVAIQYLEYRELQACAAASKTLRYSGASLMINL
jgi:hypothetical protein